MSEEQWREIIMRTLTRSEPKRDSIGKREPKSDSQKTLVDERTEGEVEYDLQR